MALANTAIYQIYHLNEMLEKSVSKTRSHEREDHMNEKITWTRRSHEREDHMNEKITWTRRSTYCVKYAVW